MQTGVLITDGGPHSTEDWAYASASMLLEGLPIDPKSPRRSRIDQIKDRLRPVLTDLFRVHHDKVQSLERAALAGGDHALLSNDIDPAEHTDIDKAIDEALAALHPLLEFASDLQTASDGLKEMVRHRVETDLNTVIWVERSHHADKNPTNEHAVAFRKLYNVGGQ